eukprot:4081395-Ditylum_brightwellii.AAC.1
MEYLDVQTELSLPFVSELPKIKIRLDSSWRERRPFAELSMLMHSQSEVKPLRYCQSVGRSRASLSRWR